MNSFGLLLKNRRLEKELTLAELEGLTGVSGSYINRLENGINHQPSYENVVNIADALGITDEEIRDCYKTRIKSLDDNDLMFKKLRVKEVKLELSIANKHHFIKLYEKFNKNELYNDKNIKKLLHSQLLCFGCATINELKVKLNSEKEILKEIKKTLNSQ